jgi:CMP-N-acetylneuraminic acid synthetase
MKWVCGRPEQAAGKESMKNIALITAKGGNQSIENKNLHLIQGKPSLFYQIQAAKEASLIDDIFVSTEDAGIKETALKNGVKVIDRPPSLAQPFSNHGDVIVHAANAIKAAVPDVGVITILLGNTVMVSGHIIDVSVKKVLEREDVDSSMTIWKAQDDHPYRALFINEKGFLEAFMKMPRPDTNRQSYPDVFFYDQGPWTVRYTSIKRCEETKDGPGPWWWMGKNCIPIERLWITGRDFHSWLDLQMAEWWIQHKMNERNSV